MNNFKPIYGKLDRQQANFHHAFLELEETIHTIKRIERIEAMYKQSEWPQSSIDEQSLKRFREQAPALIHKFVVLAQYLFGNEYEL